jgi:cobalt-zinc-cadmium efflux system outer membrane protein
MVRTSVRWLVWSVALLGLGGCSYAVREQVDLAICDLAAKPLDLPPLPPPDLTPPHAGTASCAEVQPVRYQAPEGKDEAELKPPRKLAERLQYPPELPGADAPPIRLPPFKPDDPKSIKEREAAIQRLFPPLPPLGPNPEPKPGPDGHALSLPDLQRLAIANSPLLRQAAAQVEAARGAAVQAGLYPNPTFGYETNTAGTGATAGYQGAFLDQTIKTAGKLKLARAAAVMDLRNAELAFRRTQADLASQVRAGYFAVLVAQENLKVSLALARFTDEVYRVQVDQVRFAQAAPYELAQLRVLTIQTRAALVQARNRYTSAWKQLAATLGLPGMCPTELAGRVDMPIPVYCYEQVLAWVLSKHTDVLTALNTVQRERYNLRLAQMMPIPDVEVGLAVMKDFTTPPFAVVENITVGVQLPVWDRNQGNILQAQANLLRAVEESHRVRNDLTARLAEAFERYQNNRVILEYYRNQILPDQVRAYRGAYERHQQEPDKVGFADIVNAQQILAGSIATYIGTLGDLWTAVVDIAQLLQTNDLFQVADMVPETECLPAVPSLDDLPPLPCCHPCNPLPDPGLKGADGNWPATVPGVESDPPSCSRGGNVHDGSNWAVRLGRQEGR